MLRNFSFFIGCILFSISIFAEETSTLSLGNISFPTSANAAAEKDFITGVLYLHSFVYDRAREAFLKAEAEDPSFALAYWGEAMTYNKPLWNQLELSAARKALNKLAPSDDARIAKAKLPREKGLINAVNILLGKGNKLERDAAYSIAMGQLYRQFPEDDEIGAFYALSLLGISEGERDYQTYMQAAGIVEVILQHNPNHPGALHYAIHSYDDPTHAPNGLRAARAYAKIALDAPHALHMPSHIYLALGMWDGVVSSNKAAWAAGIKNNPTGNPSNFGLTDLHSLQWLMYGYLQKHQYQEAYDLVKTMENIVDKSPTPIAKSHYALMRTAYLTESNNWNADLKSVPMETIEPSSHASEIYANALIALHRGHQAEVDKNLTELAKLSDLTTTKLNANHVNDYTDASPTSILIAKIIYLQLQAQSQAHQGNLKRAINILHKATELEAKLAIGYGPPVPVKPSQELLGDIYFLDKQYEQAYNEYVKELKLAPNRTLANEGLQRSAKALKKQGLSIPKEAVVYFNTLMVSN